MSFCCPVCSEQLLKSENTYICPHGHSFDISSKGYVNLLMSNSSGAKRHGDDRLMINARRSFLSKGFYQPLREAVFDALSAAFPCGGTLLDAGCGECWYTSYFKLRLDESGLSPEVLGVDISKVALEKANKSCGVERAVASIYKLPVASSSCDALANIFAPACPEEFSRVLRPGGRLVKAIPLERHLWELKAAVYDEPYENEVPSPELPGFRLLESRELCYDFELSNNRDITDLFNMTPYCYKTSQQDREKLGKLEKLSVSARFGVLIYEKE